MDSTIGAYSAGMGEVQLLGNSASLTANATWWYVRSARGSPSIASNHGRAQGTGWQTRMNAVLKAFRDAAS